MMPAGRTHPVETCSECKTCGDGAGQEALEEHGARHDGDGAAAALAQRGQVRRDGLDLAQHALGALGSSGAEGGQAAKT